MKSARIAKRAGLAPLAALQAAQPAAFPFLLQSMAGHPTAGRYDLLLRQSDAPTIDDGADFFARLDAAVAASPALTRSELPFVGGWFVYLGYEAAAIAEPSLHLPATPHALPRALAVRCTAALIVDRDAGCTYAVSEDDDPEVLFAALDALGPVVTASAAPVAITALVEDAPQRYLEGVERVLEYLRAGDTFQINLSRAWRAELAPGTTPEAVYAALCAANPAPFAASVRIGDTAILSSSPERLLQLDGRQLDTRPIAGTRPRSGDADEDQALRAQLSGSLKERAEHVMLIDLERNDLGRVCEPGSVRVSELMALESYAHVHHIVSNVTGTLREGLGVGDALQAVFPGGTITGCPKVRAMEIIAELEGVGRGPYTGALGYISRCGRADFNILIRSLVMCGNQLTLRAGAGIVADSVPELELAETRAKARGLLRALGQGVA